MLASLLVMAISLFFIPVNLTRGATGAAAIDVVLALAFGVNAWLASRRPDSWLVPVIPVLALFAFVAVLARTGAIQAWLWIYGLPAVVFLLGGLRLGRPLVLVLSLGLAVELWLWPPTLVLPSTSTSVVMSYLMVLVLAWVSQHEHDRLAQALVRLSSEDHLTGLANSRRFDQALDNEIARHRRYGRPFALLVFDIDHFKAINDAHGHLVGDAVLADVARAARAVVRDTDLVARIGGDEFAVLLPESGLDGARPLPHRLRAAVRLLPSLPGRELRISIGLTVFGADDNARSILARADAALYATKRGGRDGVTVRLPDGSDEGR